nr:hypothetical protein [uncultured Cohaesibacter sp.]
MPAVLACSFGLTSNAMAQQASQFEKIGDWEIMQLRSNGKVVACETFRIVGTEKGIFFRHDREKSVIGFSDLASAASPYPIDVKMWFDDDPSSSQTYAMENFKDQNSFEWRALLLSNDEPWGEMDLFANASTVHFSYDTGHGPHQASFALKNTNKVTKRTIACVQ